MSDNDIQLEFNDQLALICGVSGSGKSASLRNIHDQAKWLYLGCEAGKRLPMRNKFDSYRIEDPYQVLEAFDFAIANPDKANGIIVDSTTFLMDMFESLHVLTAANTMNAWNNYQQYFKTLMQQKVVAFGKPVLMTAHVLDTLDEKAMEVKTSVPIKGALKNNGIEAYFSTVVYCKRKSIKDLEPYTKNNPLLNITDEEAALGFKHVYQTRVTKQTIGERIRSPLEMFSNAETFMDNDAQILLDRLAEFYK